MMIIRNLLIDKPYIYAGKKASNTHKLAVHREDQPVKKESKPKYKGFSGKTIWY